LIRENLRESDLEQKALEEYDVVNNLAILKAMKTADEPAARNGAVGKGRKPQRPTAEPETPAESPGPSPNEPRVDLLKRTKGTGQRSSSVASSSRLAVAPKIEDAVDPKRGVLAERPGQLVVGTEVAIKYPRKKVYGGVGQHGFIKKIWYDKTP
jgi:hypothetical protein